MEGIPHEAIRSYCTLWCKKWNVSVSDDDEAWQRVAQTATSIISKSWGGSDPSPFKRAAATAMAIVAEAPIEPHLPQELREEHGLASEMARHPKIVKAMVGHHFAEWVLENSEIGNEILMRKLSNPMLISAHFYKDLLWLLATSEFENVDGCGAISMIYEGCAYQANPTAPDQAI